MEDKQVKRQRPISSTGVDLSTAAIMSKATKQRIETKGKLNPDGSRDFPAFVSGYIDILTSRARRSKDNKIARSLLPDTDAALEILISSILSPSEMMESTIIVNNKAPDLEPALKTSMNTSLEEYLKETYPLNNLTSDMLKEILSDNGSYVVAVLPESAIDHMINKIAVGTESIHSVVNSVYENKKIGKDQQSVTVIKHKGYLSNSAKPSGLALALNNMLIDAPSESYNPFVDLNAAEFERVVKKTSSITGIGFEANKLKFGEAEFSISDTTLAIIDNPDALKMNKIVNQTARKKQSDLADKDPGRYKGLGSIIKSAKVNEIESAVFGRTRVTPMRTVQSVPKPNHVARETYGEPLIQKIPSESVLPVFVPGDKSHHIGYFFMLDADGNPVDMSDMSRCCANLNQPLNQQSNSRLSTMLDKVESNLHDHTRKVTSVSNFTAVMYQEILERELVDRVKNGAGLNEVVIASNSDFYRVMLARSLANSYTQLLYVPVDYVTYMAFDYDDNGLGKSLMDDLSTVNLLRVMLMYNDVLASVKNSTQRTQVEVNIDPKDPDPLKTGSMVMDSLVRARSLDLSRLTFDQNDITTYLQRAGYEWNFTGNPKLPETKTIVNTSQSSIPKSDTDLNDSLKKASNFGIGVPPEMVDNSFQSEFAVTSVLNNTMFGKRVVRYGTLFSSMLSDHVRKIVVSDGNLYNKIKQSANDYFETLSKEKDALPKMQEFFKNAIKDYDFSNLSKMDDYRDIYVLYMTDVFIAGISIELPRPPSVTIQSQITELEDHLKLAQTVLDQLINTDFLTSDTQGELAASVDTIKAMILSQICREFIASKGIMPEITKITNPTTPNQEDANILVQAGKFIEGLSKAGIAVKIRNVANAKATDNILTSMGDAGEVTDTSSEVSSDSGSSSSEQDTGDDMGMTDLEMPTDEEPADEGGDTAQEPPAEEAAPPAGL